MQNSKTRNPKTITFEQAQKEFTIATARYLNHPDMPKPVKDWFDKLIGMFEKQVDMEVGTIKEGK